MIISVYLVFISLVSFVLIFILVPLDSPVSSSTPRFDSCWPRAGVPGGPGGVPVRGGGGRGGGGAGGGGGGGGARGGGGGARGGPGGPRGPRGATEKCIFRC